MTAERVTWRETWRVYRRPQTVALLFLGFAAGLPYLLVFSTLSARLVEADWSRGAIGLLSWVGVFYSVKVLWAPFVDRWPVPWLSACLGHRRAWMLASQLAVAAGLATMAVLDARADLLLLTCAALFVSLGSATQDISVDAFRIESAETDMQAALAAAYILGYRVALLFAGAGALHLAEAFDWRVAYAVMALSMTAGMATVLLSREPPVSARTPRTPRIRLRDFTTPFTDFFARYGRLAVWVLLFIGVFRMSDISLGVMANPFYLDAGYTKGEIANVSKVFGFLMTIAGAGLGGLLVVRYGVARLLAPAALLTSATNLLFAWLATQAPDLTWLAVVISADNLSGGMATAVFIAYLSGLTGVGHTATQYALFSSFMTLPAKLLGGMSGFVVEAAGYVGFFLYTAALGVPAILLAAWLCGVRPRPTTAR